MSTHLIDHREVHVSNAIAIESSKPRPPADIISFPGKIAVGTVFGAINIIVVIAFLGVAFYLWAKYLL